MTFVGLGYSEALNDPEKEHESPPDQKIVTRVLDPVVIIIILWISILLN